MSDPKMLRAALGSAVLVSIVCRAAGAAEPLPASPHGMSAYARKMLAAHEIDMRFGAKEIGSFVRRTACKALFHAPDHRGKNTAVALEAIAPADLATLKALVAVGDDVAAHEPGTLDYRVIRVDGGSPVLITHERFRDRAALASHNEGAGSKAFFAATAGLLGDVMVLVGDEVSSVQGNLS